MPWKNRLVESQKYVEMTFSGNISPEELYEAIEISVALAHDNNIKLFLTDCTTVLGGLSIIDLYGLIPVFKRLQIGRDVKNAVIMPTIQESIKKIKFYETLCTNRGFNVKIFTKYDEALSWLISIY
jgi:hypothetical protein